MYFTHPLVTELAANYKQHILSPAEAIKVCYSLAEHYVKSVYMNLFRRRGHKVHKTFLRRGQAIKFCEPLVYLLRNCSKIKYQKDCSRMRTKLDSQA
jgi:hypothetical protein